MKTMNNSMVTDEPAPEIRTVLRDSLASGLTMAYGCSRDWRAWGVGTMSQDDFYPASECDDLLEELCDLAIAVLRPDLTDPGITVAVPDGWKLVPVEPTEEMMHAAQDVPAPRPYGAVFRAMINAAIAAKAPK